MRYVQQFQDRERRTRSPAGDQKRPVPEPPKDTERSDGESPRHAAQVLTEMAAQLRKRAATSGKS
jgi:hypothetical protein